MSDRLAGLADYLRGMARLAATARDPARLTKLSQRLHALADQEIVLIQSEAAGRGIVPACCAGCDHCCYRLIEATLPEGVEIAQHMAANWSEEDRIGFQDRLKFAEELNAPFFSDRSRSANAPCPFLIDRNCSIYEIRPLGCRAMNSTDVEPCRKVFREGQIVVIPAIEAQVGVNRLDGGVIAGTAEIGLASGRYDLGPLVSTLLEDPELAISESHSSSKMERIKVYSERNSISQPFPPTVTQNFSVPERNRVVDFIRSGHAHEAWQALERLPRSPFQSLYRLIMPDQYRSQEELEIWWRRWGHSVDVFASEALPAKETFDLVQAFNTFTLAYAAKDVRPYMEKFMGKICELAKKAYPHLCAPIEAPRTSGRFRLGYVGSQISNFNGSRWAIGWLMGHSKEIETTVINMIETEDDTSLAFRRHADRYLHLPYTAPEVGQIVRDLDLDALIFTDIGMGGRSLQLAAFRLARRQLNSWGHPVTSGSPQMDDYLSSVMMESQNAAEHYSERLVRLPGSGLCYPHRKLYPSQKTHSDLGLPEGGFLLMCQHTSKLVPHDDHLLQEVAAWSKKPLVVIRRLEQEGPIKERLGTKNVIYLPRQSASDYLRTLQLADVSLDTPSWNGGNTTIEALTLGTPVVSMAGEFMRGRHSLAFLNQAGLGQLIATNGADYVDIALDESRQAAAMASLDLDALYEDPAPVQALDVLLLNSHP